MLLCLTEIIPIINRKKLFEVKMKKLDPGIKIYSGNLETFENRNFSHGGRILSLTNYSSNPYQCFNTIYNNICKITYQNRYFRRDIGISLIKSKTEKKVKVAVLGSTKGSSTQKLISNCKKTEYLDRSCYLE